MANSVRRWRGILPLLAVVLGACGRHDHANREEALSLLHAAIAAHGGRERLRQFAEFHLVSEGTFRGAASMRRIVDYRGPDEWAMRVAFEHGALRMGVDGSRCWKEERYRVDPCAGAGERNEIFVSAIEHNAWVLDTIDEASVEPAAAQRANGRDLPAIRRGEMLLAFDPASHRLAEVHHGTRIDRLSAYREVAGVLIATRREVILDGVPDLDERWIEIVPGQAETAALRPPPKPADGVIRDDVDAPRSVAWVELQDPLAEAPAAVNRLDEAVRRLGHNPSASDGLIWSPPAADDPSGRWRLAVGVEVGSPIPAHDSEGVHFEMWPAMREIGIYHASGVVGFGEKRSRLERLAREHGLAPEEMRLQVLTSRDVLRAQQRSMSLVRLVAN